MGERAPYSRVYWSVVDDEKFDNIYSDDRHLSTWLRLLIAADAIWPASATLPASARKASIKALADANLIDLLKDHRYRIHGLDAERGRRAKAATSRPPGDEPDAPSGDQPVPKRGPSGTPHGPSRGGDALLVSSSSSSSPENGESVAESARVAIPPLPVKDMGGVVSEVPIGGATRDADVPRLQQLAEELTQQPYAMGNVHGGLGGKAVVEQLRPHGFDRVARAWRRVAAQVTGSGQSYPTLRQLVFGADDILNVVPKPDAKEERAEDAQAAFDRRVARTQAEIRRSRGEPEPA